MDPFIQHLIFLINLLHLRQQFNGTLEVWKRQGHVGFIGH